MKRWMMVIVLLIAALVLAACGDDDEDDADTPQVDSPVEQSDPVGGDDDPLGPVSFTIAGAPEGDRTVQASQFALQRFEDAYFLTMESRDEDPSLITLENIPLELEEASYPIGSPGGESDGITARVEIGPEGDVAVYDQAVEGTLAITAVAEGAISGTFQFSASPANAPEVAQTIAVSGAFNDLALP